MRKRFTPALIESGRLVAEAKKAKGGRIEVRDTQSRLILRVTTAGARSFITRPRFNGTPIRLTYAGAVSPGSYSAAKIWADTVAGQCAQGIDPRIVAKREAEDTFANIADTFMTRHASKNRTAAETQRILDRYILPSWKNKPISDISRRDVAYLLDRIEDRKIQGPKNRMLGGPVQADRVLAVIRKLMNWHAARDDSFVSPVVRGMGRTKPKERARDRILSDEEIRTIWPLLDEMGTFGGIVTALFLTAQRRDEVAHMARAEIKGDVWTIPADRYKTGKSNVVPLSDAAYAVIENQPVFATCDLVFTTSGRNPFSGFSRAKRNLDIKMLKAMGEQEVWRLHDIRRTAKTLMMRAGVRPDISERVLGHAIPGVEAVYDRHSYLDEKRDALDRLAEIICDIIKPSGRS